MLEKWKERALPTLARPIHAGVSDDLDVLVHALQPQPGRRFVTISAHGAGEAALTLAAMGADRVLAHDVGDAETLDRLLTLKLAAAHLMGREDYLAVMGLRPASKLRRRALADQLVRSFGDPNRAYWRARRGWLVDGLFHSDQQALFFSAFRGALRVLAPAEARREILQGATPESRVGAFRQHVQRAWLERILAAVGARVNLFFPDAEWEASEYPKAFNRAPLDWLERLVQAGIGDNPLFAHLAGDSERPIPEALLPVHLRPGAYDLLRTASVRVRVVRTRPGERLPLTDAPPPIHGAYLSNVIDYLDADARAAVFHDLRATLAPGAPILVYSNEAWDKVPAEGLTLDVAATEELERLDRAHIYRRIALYRQDAPTGADLAEGGERRIRLRVVTP